MIRDFKRWHDNCRSKAHAIKETTRDYGNPVGNRASVRFKVNTHSRTKFVHYRMNSHSNKNSHSSRKNVHSSPKGLKILVVGYIPGSRVVGNNSGSRVPVPF